jgi:hypothetical protein
MALVTCQQQLSNVGSPHLKQIQTSGIKMTDILSVVRAKQIVKWQSTPFVGHVAAAKHLPQPCTLPRVDI